jgi:hypothetical protein
MLAPVGSSPRLACPSILPHYRSTRLPWCLAGAADRPTHSQDARTAGAQCAHNADRHSLAAAARACHSGASTSGCRSPGIPLPLPPVACHGPVKGARCLAPLDHPARRAARCTLRPYHETPPLRPEYSRPSCLAQRAAAAPLRSVPSRVRHRLRRSKPPPLSRPNAFVANRDLHHGWPNA